MIGVVDSGAGGLSVLKEITRLLPAEKYIYYSDNANCPYGGKSRDFIVERMRHITEFLLSEGVDIIVVACNTATSAAISTLREEYSDEHSDACRTKVLGLTGGRCDHVRFIGMEPAVKPAALGTRSGVIGVLATAGTLKGSKYLASKGNVEDNVKVVEHVGRGFVELVESGKLEGAETERVVSESLMPLLDAGADIVVLGCTHYPFLLPVMKKIAGKSIRFIDPAPAVARHLIYVMVQEKLLSEADASLVLARMIESAESDDMGDSPSAGLQPAPSIHLLSSGDSTTLTDLFHRIYAD